MGPKGPTAEITRRRNSEAVCLSGALSGYALLLCYWDSFELASRFKLTPASAALIARLR